MTDTIDDKITQLLTQVKEKRAAFKLVEQEIKTPWKTNCVIALPNRTYTIQTLKKEEVRDLVSQLLMTNAYQEQANKMLGLEDVTTVNGMSIEDIITDCKKRIKVINSKAQKDQLDKLESKLNGLVSAEKRRSMELESVMAELGTI